MTRLRLALVIALPLIAAASVPGMLAQARGGLWEVKRAPSPERGVRQCIADTAQLAQYEHRSASCTRVVISQTPSSAVIHYTCAGGGFGRSEMTLVTPRSLRIETQGISGNAPFHYVIHARRVGDCAAH